MEECRVNMLNKRLGTYLARDNKKLRQGVANTSWSFEAKENDASGRGGGEKRSSYPDFWVQVEERETTSVETRLRSSEAGMWTSCLRRGRDRLMRKDGERWSRREGRTVCGRCRRKANNVTSPKHA